MFLECVCLENVRLALTGAAQFVKQEPTKGKVDGLNLVQATCWFEGLVLVWDMCGKQLIHVSL